jgi:hypothetical protein
MLIDNSAYEAFVKNPEKYRLAYEANGHAEGIAASREARSGGLSPLITPFALARGTIMHFYLEHWKKQTPQAEIVRLLGELKPEKRAHDVGWAMAQSTIQKFTGDPRFEQVRDEQGVYVEREFKIQIPGSPHFIIGRMDEITKYEGELWVLDEKSANAKASENKKTIEFGYSAQPIFYIVAARHLGFNVKGMLYRVTTEHVTPQHWLIKSKRTDHAISVGLLNIHQVAEQIEMMRRTFGTDVPWPHNYFHYPCNYEYNGKPTCEYATICQRPTSELGEVDLEQFSVRHDHLDLMNKEE